MHLWQIWVNVWSKSVKNPRKPFVYRVLGDFVIIPIQSFPSKNGETGEKFVFHCYSLL